MANLALFSLAVLHRPLEIVRNRARARLERSGDASPGPIPADAERAERIATYARAGYFHMGYTFDAFRPIDETPLD